ncbi:hypothetical protein OBBRIDRAFT_787168 [Obba rivulosa]|uniref:G-patch domain-containing protein n=1 Tax=Obba rivulosa TaxID=1052685 RepID=A0A8E2DVV5_9APHY|nr:hypothetical protein OBBRIDRAFT_787168 [Obba rivulosa]
MSAETIARWNAIPIERTQDDPSHTLKRQREHGRDEDEESEDNVSLVSRSPSPPPRDANAMDIDKYDEYVKGAEQDVVTVNTKIKATNKGFKMLASMGWVDGQPLGLSGDGRVDPVPFYVKNDLTGLGKANQDVRMIESTVSQRRELEVERQTKETEEQRRAREDAVAKKAALQSQIFSTLRAFYCELCDKQFQNVAQYDEHTNSYAHHHKARFRDMQLAQRANKNTQEEVEKRKEKERKREEKELRKLAKAVGIKLTKPQVSLLAPSSPSATAIADDSEAKPSGFKKAEWATVSSSATQTSTTGSSVPAPAAQPSSASSFKRSGWATVGSVASEASTSASTSASASGTANRGPPTSSPQPSYDPAPASQSQESPPSRAAPSFRTGGWTSLDTGSTLPPAPALRAAPPPPPLSGLPEPPAPVGRSPQQPPPNFAPAPPAAAPPLPPVTRGGWSSVGGYSAGTSQPPRQDFSSSMQPGPPPPAGNWSRTPAESPPQSQAPQATGRKPALGPVRQETSRSGWQQFRAGAPGRRR